MLADTHCHLDFHAFDADRTEVIQRALDNGIELMVNPGIDLASSREAVKIAEDHPSIYAAVGVHPSEANSWGRQTFSELRDLAKHPKVVAIGEIGLDYYHNQDTARLQRRILEEQLELALELGKPVILHTRQAMVDMIAVLESWYKRLLEAGSPLTGRPGVLHAFEGTPEDARAVLARNFFLGVGGPVTYPNAVERQALVAGLPLKRILLETDAPFLTPQSHRGRRNEPAFIIHVAQKVAELLQLPVSEVARTTTENAAGLFAWGV